MQEKKKWGASLRGMATTNVGPVQLALTAGRTVPGYVTVTGVLLAVVTWSADCRSYCASINSRANRTRLWAKSICKHTLAVRVLPWVKTLPPGWWCWCWAEGLAGNSLSLIMPPLPLPGKWAVGWWSRWELAEWEGGAAWKFLKGLLVQ